MVLFSPWCWRLCLLLVGTSNHLLNCKIFSHKCPSGFESFKQLCNNGLTLIWATGLDALFSLFRAEGERGPEEFGTCGRGVILAPGEICMLASWAAYSCCKKGRNQQNRQAINIARQPLVSGFPLSFSLPSSPVPPLLDPIVVFFFCCILSLVLLASSVVWCQTHTELIWKQMCVYTDT